MNGSHARTAAEAAERAEQERRDAVVLARGDITDPEYWAAFRRAVGPGLTSEMAGMHPWGCSHP